MATAAAGSVLALAGLAGCVGKGDKKPNLFGIPLSSDPSLSERQQRQLDLFDRTVRNPSEDIDPETRRQAAEELIAMNLPEATERLSQALQSGEPAVRMAVIEAMHSWPEPVMGLLPAATGTLQDVSGEELERLTLVLPRYGNDALQRVAALARDRSQPPAARIGPIDALAAFRSREAAVVLMDLLEAPEGEPPQPPEPPEIIAATGSSLERLTGLPYGSDAEQWRRWWDRLKNEPIEDWLRIMVLHLSTRTAELERQIHAERQENEQIAARLTETLREVFLSLSADEQLNRLPELLRDSLAPVRAFALGRVERRLRDSERIPEPVQENLAERLTDPTETPRSRLLAAHLLNDLNYQTTSYLVAATLAEQTDPAIAAGYLEILAKRPAPMALEQILNWLMDPMAGPAAADALWAMVTADMIGEKTRVAARDGVRAAMERGARPQLVRVMGAVGDGKDRETVEELLDSPDPKVRRAAAEGLAFIGELDPLRQRATDEEIYPFLVRALARQPAGVKTLAAIADLPPPDIHRQEWTQTVKAAADALPPSDLADADDALAFFEHVELDLRAAILARVVGLPPDAVSIEQRGDIMTRLARLRLEMGDYQGAYEAMAWTNGAPSSREQAALRFEVAVLAGHLDEAAAMNSDVLTWIALLDKLIEQRPQVAAIVRDEIRRRFPNELQGEAGEAFRAAAERLSQEAITVAPGRGDRIPE